MAFCVLLGVKWFFPAGSFMGLDCISQDAYSSERSIYGAFGVGSPLSGRISRRSLEMASGESRGRFPPLATSTLSQIYLKSN